MGKKKGKMSALNNYDGSYPKKWMKNELAKNLNSYVDQARQEAYNKSLIDRRRKEQQVLQRPKLHFPFLANLLSERVRSDLRGHLNSQNQHIFNVHTNNKKLEMYQTKLKTQARQYFHLLQADLHNSPNRNSPLSLQLLCLQNVAKHLTCYEEEDFLFLLKYLTIDLVSYLNYFGCLYQSLDESKMFCFSRFPLETVYFTSPAIQITTKEETEPTKKTKKESSSSSTSMIQDYLQLLTNNSFHNYEEEENWEEIDLNLINYFDRRKYLQKVIIYEMKYGLTELQFLLENAENIYELQLIHSDMIDEKDSAALWRAENEKTDSSGILLKKQQSQSQQLTISQQFLFLLLSRISSSPSSSSSSSSSSSPHSLTISLVYCSWVDYQSFKDFLTHFILPSIPSQSSSSSLPAYGRTINLHVTRLAEDDLIEDDSLQRKWDGLCGEYENLSPSMKLFVQRVLP
jgi:hypothetical protein